MTISAQIHSGISIFTTMIPLLSDPKFESSVAEEQDLKLELNTLKSELTAYDSNTTTLTAFIEGVKTRILKGTTREEVNRLLTFYGPMFYLIILPLLNMLKDCNEEDISSTGTALIDETLQALASSTNYGTVEEARKTRSAVMQTIRQRDKADHLTISERTFAILLALDAE